MRWSGPSGDEAAFFALHSLSIAMWLWPIDFHFDGRLKSRACTTDWVAISPD